MGCSSSNFYILSVGFVHSRQRILEMATLTVIVVVVIITTAHAFVLTVSHGLLFRQPLDMRRHRCRRFTSPECHSIQRQISPYRPRAVRKRFHWRKRFHLNLTIPQQSGPPAIGITRGAANFSSCTRLLRSMRADPMKLHGSSIHGLQSDFTV